MSTGEFERHEALIEQLRAGTLSAPDHLRRRVLLGRTSRRERWAEKSFRRKAFVVISVAATLALGAAVVQAAFTSGTPVGRPAGHSVPFTSLQAGGQRPTGVNGATGATGPTGPQGTTGANGLT